MHFQKYADRIKLFPDLADDINWAFEQVRQKRVLGSQRALQFGGEPILKKNARMYNCSMSFCDRIRFFQETLFMLLCGSGVGFSVQKHHIAKLPEFSNELKINKNKVEFKGKKTFVIPDSIEGWSDSLGILLASYMHHKEFSEYEGYEVEFDYSQIRPAGSFISSGSGKAPGPEPLKRSLEIIRNLLNERIIYGFKKLRPIDAYDIVMHASDAVLSGGIRRSATLCLFSPDDEEMATAKTGNWFVDNPQRARSNNSALLIRNKTSKEEFEKLMKSVREFGEPGFVFSDSTEQIPNPSLRKGTKVLTQSGIFPIEELENKTFKVKNLHGDWSEAICRLSGKNKKLIEIVLENNFKYYATEEHKWPVFNKLKNCYEKRESNKLMPDDKLPINCSSELFESNFGDEKDGFLCGWNLTDGWQATRKDNGKKQWGFIVSLKDVEYGIKDKIDDAINEKTICDRSFKWSLRDSKCFELNLQRKSLSDYFAKFGLDHKSKGVPERFWIASESFRKGFIDAIYSADGSVSTNEKTIYQLILNLLIKSLPKMFKTY